MTEKSETDTRRVALVTQGMRVPGTTQENRGNGTIYDEDEGGEDQLRERELSSRLSC